MPYALNMFDTLAPFAARSGATGDNWREQVLQDLLSRGSLRVLAVKGGDKNSGGERCSFELYGRKLTAHATVDRKFGATLFVMGLYPGPEAGGRRCPPDAVEVPGPWTLLGVNFRVQPGQPDLYALLMSHVSQPPPAQVVPPPRIGTVSSMAEAILAQHRAAQARATPPSAPPTPTAPAPKPSPVSSPTQVATQPPPVASGPPPAAPAQVVLPIEPAVPEPPPHDAVPTPSEEVPASGEAHTWERLVRAWTLARHPEHAPFLQHPHPAEALLAERQHVEAQIAALHARLDALPSVGSLESLLQDEQGFLGGLPEIAPGDLVALAQGPGLSDLAQALAFRTSAAFTILPPWVREAFGDLPTEVLAEDHRVTELRAVQEFIQQTFSGQPPATLATLPQATGASLASTLASAWRDHSRRAAVLAGLGVAGDPDTWTSVPTSDLDQIAAILGRWTPILSPDARSSLISSLHPADLPAWYTKADPAWAEALSDENKEFLRGQPSWGFVLHMRALVQSRPAPPTADAGASPTGVDPAPPPAPPPPPSPPPLPPPPRANDLGEENPLLSITHAVSGSAGGVASPNLYVRERDKDRALSLLRVPVRVRSSAALNGDYILRLRAEHLQSMPQQVMPEADDARIVAGDGRSLERTLSVSDKDWDATGSERDGRVYYLDLIITVPGFRAHVKTWKQKGLRLEITLQHNSGAQVRGSLSFDSFQDKLQHLKILESDSTDAKTMQRAPLGVQEGYEALEQVIQSGGKSFLVAAPRRFGKTTLLHYLAGLANEQPGIWVSHVALNRNASPRESMLRVLEQISQSVAKKFQTRPEMPWNEEGVPPATTFEPLRRMLAEKGYAHIILFIDEAQSLVPRRDSGRWGTDLKNLIENELARGEAGLARMSIILFGTSALPVRLGDNCRNFLRGKEVFSFTESSLDAFLRHQIRGIVRSTPAARQRLAEAANNLWTLIALLNQIGEQIHADERMFFLSSDVSNAVEQLLSRNLAESHSSLWSYVSAELNQQDDEWDPIDAYPVALALASDGLDTRGGVAIRDAVIRWLSVFLTREQLPVMIAPERIDICIDDLKRLHVLRRDGSFQRPLLRAFLRQRAMEAPFTDGADENALLRLAVDQIRWDATATKRSHGGQATVFVSETPGEKPRAWRVADLSNPDARRRFMRVCAAIQALRDVSTRVTGDNYLPAVREAGLDEDDSNRGVLIYDWIEGEKYQDLRATLPELARAHVVCQVARGLEALHCRDVVHRDVHPRNVLVDATLRAWLIDFGMACLVNAAGLTVIPDPAFQAPELARGATATPASDIYALGAMLDETGSGLQNGALRRIHRELTAEAPESRPRAMEVARRLEDILTQSNFHSEQVSAEKRIQDVINDSVHNWLFDALFTFQQEAVIRQCYTSWGKHSALLLAHILNTLFVSYVQESDADEAQQLLELDWGRDLHRMDPSLAALKRAMDHSPEARLQHKSIWASPGVQVAGHLRNAFAHPGKRDDFIKMAERVTRRGANQGGFRAELDQAAAALDQVFGTRVVRRFAAFFLPVTNG